MTDYQRISPVKVMGPGGEPLTESDLPPRETKRWVPSRKAKVVLAVKGGLLTIEEACVRYNLSLAEFMSWKRAFESEGLSALRATRGRKHRKG